MILSLLLYMKIYRLLVFINCTWKFVEYILYQIPKKSFQQQMYLSLENLIFPNETFNLFIKNYL